MQHAKQQPRYVIWGMVGALLLTLFGGWQLTRESNAMSPYRPLTGAALTQQFLTGECQVDAASSCTVAHKLGSAKIAAVVTPGDPGQLASVPHGGYTADSFRVKFNWRTGSTFPAGTKIRFSAVVGLQEAGPTPTPTPTSSPTLSPSPSPSPTASPSTSPSPTPTSTPTAPVRCTDPVFTGTAPDSRWSDPRNSNVVVNNEVWNRTEAGPQTIHVCSSSSWFVTSDQTGSAIKSYPDTQVLYSNPQIGSIPSMVSRWSHEAPDAGEWNAAYDIWLNGWDRELMIWTEHRYGGSAGAPLPPGNAIDKATPTIDGVTYTAWRRDADTPGDRNYIALVRTSEAAAGQIDLKAVFNWLVSKGWLQNTNTLQAVDYGIEIADTAGGPATFRLNDFHVSPGMR